MAERSGREDHSEKFGFLCILGHICQRRRGQAPPPAAQIKAIFVLTIILESLVSDLVATLKMSSCYGAGRASGGDGSKAQLFCHIRSPFYLPARFGGAATLPANFLSKGNIDIGQVPSNARSRTRRRLPGRFSDRPAEAESSNAPTRRSTAAVGQDHMTSGQRRHVGGGWGL